MKVFISYSTEDLPIATRLYGDMRAAGAEVFQFGASERFGQSSWEQVLQWISDSDVFLVLISHSALKSRPVRHEIDHAHHACINFERPELIPAIIETGAQPPNLIRRFVTLDLVAYESGMSRLIGQLGLKPPKKNAIPALESALPDPGALFSEYKKKNPDPDPISLWSKKAEKLLANYERVKPPTLDRPA